VIDFQDVDDKHGMCEWKDGNLYEGKPEPDTNLIGCEDIHETAQDMQLWKLRLTYMKRNDGYPDQEDLDKLGPSLICHPKYRDDLLGWVKGYTTCKGKLSAEEYMAKYPSRQIVNCYYFP